MPRIKAITFCGYPDGDRARRDPVSGELPFHDISALAVQEGEIQLIIDDEEYAGAADGWGILIDMSEREAHLLAYQLDALLAHRHEK